MDFSQTKSGIKGAMQWGFKNPEFVLGGAGVITAIASWGAKDMYIKKQADPLVLANPANLATAQKREQQAEVAMTVGWTLLAASALLGGLKVLSK